MCFIIKNFRKVENEYFADLFNQQTGDAIPVKIVPNAGGWGAIETEGEFRSWEIDSVKTVKSNIEDWCDGDELVLGNRIN